MSREAKFDFGRLPSVAVHTIFHCVAGEGDKQRVESGKSLSAIQECRHIGGVLSQRFSRQFAELFHSSSTTYASWLQRLVAGLSSIELQRSDYLQEGLAFLRTADELIDGARSTETNVYYCQRSVLALMTAERPLELTSHAFSRFIQALEYLAAQYQVSEEVRNKVIAFWRVSLTAMQVREGVAESELLKEDFQRHALVDQDDDTVICFLPFFDFSQMPRADRALDQCFVRSELSHASLATMQFASLVLKRTMAMAINCRNIKVSDEFELCKTNVCHGDFSAMRCIESVVIENTPAKQSIWSGAHLGNIAITQSNFSGADMSASRIYKGSISDVDFSYADLTAVHWAKVRYKNINIQHARLSVQLLYDLVDQKAIKYADIDWGIQSDEVKAHRNQLDIIYFHGHLIDLIKARKFKSETIDWLSMPEAIQNDRRCYESLAQIWLDLRPDLKSMRAIRESGTCRYASNNYWMRDFSGDRRSDSWVLSIVNRIALDRSQFKRQLSSFETRFIGVVAGDIHHMRSGYCIKGKTYYDHRYLCDFAYPAVVAYGGGRWAHTDATGAQVQVGSEWNDVNFSHVALDVIMDYHKVGYSFISAHEAPFTNQKFSMRLAGSLGRAVKIQHSIIKGDFFYGDKRRPSSGYRFACFHASVSHTQLSGCFRAAQFANVTFSRTTFDGDFVMSRFCGKAIAARSTDAYWGGGSKYETLTKAVYFCVVDECDLRANFSMAQFSSVKFQACTLSGRFNQMRCNEKTVFDRCILNEAVEFGVNPQLRHASWSGCVVSSHRVMMQLILSGVDVVGACDWGAEGQVKGRDAYLHLQQIINDACELLSHGKESDLQELNQRLAENLLTTNSLAEAIACCRTLGKAHSHRLWGGRKNTAYRLIKHAKHISLADGAGEAVVLAAPRR